MGKSDTITYTATAEATVKIEVRDREAIERVTGLGGDEWRSYAYPLHTERDVLEHWGYNAVANGVMRANQLDGWGDLDDDAVRMWVEVTDVDA